MRVPIYLTNQVRRGLEDDYTHQTINHAEEYVRDHVTTNRIENFWTLLKRTIKDSYA